MEDSEDHLRLWPVTPNVFSHILTPQRLIRDHHPSASHCPSRRVHPFRTAHQHKGLTARVCEGSPARAQAALVCPCFHQDGVNVGLSSNDSPCGRTANRRATWAAWGSEPRRRWLAGRCSHHHPPTGRRALTTLGCSLARGSTRRSAVCAAWSWCSMGYVGFLPLPTPAPES